MVVNDSKKKTKIFDKFLCEYCDVTCKSKSELKQHFKTMHNLMIVKNAMFYFCEKCNFTCSKKSEFDRHNSTRKHKMVVNDSKNAKAYLCICGKSYKYDSGYYRHKKTCNVSFFPTPDIENNTSSTIISNIDNNSISENEKNTQKETINLLMKQNQELINIIKNDNHTHITNNNISNNQKTFNLQIFLNEECKNAMNISEFIDNIKLQLCDIDKIGNEGYTKGITNIIVKELNSIDENQRPIHCSDTKRETLYVKDDNRWEKDIEKDKINKMINSIESKNIQMLDQWKEANPGYDDSSCINSDTYNQIIMNSMDSSKENKDKVIRNIVKNVNIQK